jgi:endonuclease-3
MLPFKRRKRTERARKLNATLKEIFPEQRILLNHKNSWELLVAVILSAQCTDARVNQATRSLFKRFKTIKSYAAAPQAVLEKAIYTCGFYRNKARNIKEAAKMILKIHKGEVPHTMESLLALPGVARKTANVVLSNAFEIHEGIAVDTHVRRFAIRFDLSDYNDPVRIERDLLEIMPREEWQGFNHRLVMYGREICPARKHDCKDHPLTRIYPKAKEVWPKSR